MDFLTLTMARFTPRGSGQNSPFHFQCGRIMNRDAYLAVVLICFSFSLYFVIIPLEVPTPEFFVTKTMPPDFFPICIAVMLGILSSILLIQTLKRLPSKKGQEMDTMDANHKGLLRPAIASFLFFVYFFAIYGIGWIIATGIALPGLMIYFGTRKLLTIILLAVLVPLILFLFFEKIVLVPLPKGILFE